MRSGLIATLIFALLLPIAASAQAIGAIGGEAFSVSVSPQYPEPMGRAIISMLSSTIDLANATIVVSVAGKEIYRGNAQPVAIPLGKAGSVTTAKVTAIWANESYTQTISIQPQDVAIIAEPISSAPVLYPGKPLVPIEGSVRVVAVANVQDSKGKMLDPASLSYSWTVDDTRIANSSGIGKTAIIVASPLEYRSRSVSVAVTSQDGALAGGASFSLSAQQPSVRIYENDPLLGIVYDRALSDAYNISGTEDTLFAAPFSFPITNGAPLLQWFLNGEAVQTGNSITLRPTGSGQGNASLSLVASAGESAKATENLSLSFGAAPGGGFFGL